MARAADCERAPPSCDDLGERARAADNGRGVDNQDDSRGHPGGWVLRRLHADEQR